ncbi:MAG TPA: mucoidy inhibitor MuiA family protein [Methylocystis sp.]
MRFVTLLAAAAPFLMASAFAGAAAARELEATSAIVAVVVHPDAATVTRESTVDLPAGASTVLIKGAPFPIIPDSLRASGEAQTPLTIGAVEERVAPAASEQPESAVAARLRELRAARLAVKVAIEALNAKLAMVVRYSQASPEKLASDARPLAVSDWTAAFDTVAAAHAKAGEELRVASAKAHELDEEIHGLESQRGGAKKWLTRDIAVGVDSAAGGPAKIVLTYQTAAASWKPAYEARLDTGDKDKAPELELLRRAVVTQKTGEDWRDVALSVSTARARRAAAAPEVIPQRVAFAEPPPAPAPLPAARAKSDAPEPAAPAAGQVRAAARFTPALEATAELDAGGYSATFKIAGPVGAPGDGSAKTFPLSSRMLRPKLTIRAAPALDPTAYLEAHIVNEDEAPLLPGQLTVLRDGVYVGTSRVELVAPGDAADFGFGADDRVKISRYPVKRKENEPGWFGQGKTDAREFKTSVKNLHDLPVSVTIVDQIPFSENAGITVETLPQTTPPTEKQPGDKRGVLAWSFDLQPGEAKDIHLAWRLKWPADREIMLEPAPR